MLLNSHDETPRRVPVLRQKSYSTLVPVLGELALDGIDVRIDLIGNSGLVCPIGDLKAIWHQSAIGGFGRCMYIARRIEVGTNDTVRTARRDCGGLAHLSTPVSLLYATCLFFKNNEWSLISASEFGNRFGLWSKKSSWGLECTCGLRSADIH